MHRHSFTHRHYYRHHLLIYSSNTRSEKLIQFDDFGSPQQPASPPISTFSVGSGNETDLLGFSSPVMSGAAASSTPVQSFGAMKDFLGLDASSPMPLTNINSSANMNPMSMGMQSSNNFSNSNNNSTQKLQQQPNNININNNSNNNAFGGFTMNPAMGTSTGMSRSNTNLTGSMPLGMGSVNTNPMGGQGVMGQGMNSGYGAANLNVYRNSATPQNNSNNNSNMNINNTGKR